MIGCSNWNTEEWEPKSQLIQLYEFGDENRDKVLSELSQGQLITDLNLHLFGAYGLPSLSMPCCFLGE